LLNPNWTWNFLFIRSMRTRGDASPPYGGDMEGVAIQKLSRFGGRRGTGEAHTRRNLLLIDETTLTRECLVHMLRQHAPDLAIDSAPRPADAPDERPDLVLLNIHAARVDDAEALRQIADVRRRFSDPPVVIIAEPDDSRLAIEAIRRQLRGYLPTSLSANVLAAAVRLVLAGGTFVPEPERLIAEHGVADRTRPWTCADSLGLTRREHDVVALLRQGKPNKLIAYELAISEATVKVHIRSIMRKLRATNRTQLALLAQKAPLGSIARTAA
jgi:DNA-binding NarL/FixJ family response regulator